jgi:hypothetical protein
MQDRPQLRVIDVERIARRIVDQPRNNLSRFDSNLPIGEGAGADVPPQRSAEEQDAAQRPA